MCLESSFSSLSLIHISILEMDMLGHSFYMFNNVETGRAATVYRRKDGGCGLIELENL